MNSVMEVALLGGGAFVASMLAAVAGFGGAAVLLPILVFEATLIIAGLGFLIRG